MIFPDCPDLSDECAALIAGDDTEVTPEKFCKVEDQTVDVLNLPKVLKMAPNCCSIYGNLLILLEKICSLRKAGIL